MASDPTPASELKQLNFLVGRWESSGEVLESSSTEALDIKGTDSYEWIMGGFFLLHKVDVMMGGTKTEVIEIISYDTTGGRYNLHSFDNQGNFTTMHANIKEEGVLKITGEKMRSTLILGNYGKHMMAHWEQAKEGSTWLPWMNMKFSKLL